MNEFIKKNRVSLFLFLILILLTIWTGIREKRIKADAREFAMLQERYSEINKDRYEVARQAAQLRFKFDSLQRVKYKIEEDLKKKQSELYWLQAKHKREIDSLVKADTPLDTLYLRTMLMYTNYDNGKFVYPYSGSQVKQFYVTGVNYPRMKEEFYLTKKLLSTCYDLNGKYDITEKNLQNQLSIMKRDSGMASDQINLQREQMKDMTKIIRRKTFWQYVEGIMAATGWTIAALK
jgi:hypothetical protein